MSAQAAQRVIALAAIAALAGCDDGQAPRSADAPVPEVEVTAGANPASAPVLDQDIEAPEVFQVADEGLWDGRPSLGGIWVAHSDVTDPERVIIRNEDNGRSITAALFRRERENPGPRFQVSSDAAEALGMLAGAPATLSVTALRREEAPEPATEEAAIAETEPAAADEAPAQVAEADTAADDAAMAGTPEAAAAEAARIAAAEAAAAEPAPKKRGLFGFLRRKPAEPEAPVLDTAALADAPLADGTAPADGAEIAAATTAVLADIEVATLSDDGTATPVAAPVVAAAPAIADTPKPKRRGLFGLGRRDEAPLSALADDTAEAAPEGAAPLDIAAAAPPRLTEVLADPVEPVAAPVEVAAAPVLAEPAPRRRGLFGFGRHDPAPLSALAEGGAQAAPVGAAPLEVAAAPLEAVGDPIDPMAAPVEIAAAPAVAEPAPRRRGLFGFGRRQEEPLSALDPVEVAAALPAGTEAAAPPVAEAAAPAPRKGLFARSEQPAAEAPAEVEVAALGEIEAAGLDPAADFVQVGRFPSLDEAEQAAAGLRSGGVLPSLRRGGDGDWLVLVGPLPDPADRPAILDKVKSLGYADAYLVPG